MCIYFPESPEETLPHEQTSPSESARRRQLCAWSFGRCLLDILGIGEVGGRHRDLTTVQSTPTPIYMGGNLDSGRLGD